MPSTLSAAEIISIIQACAANSVAKFALGELDVQFSGYRPPVSQTAAFAKQLQSEQAWESQTFTSPLLPEVE